MKRVLFILALVCVAVPFRLHAQYDEPKSAMRASVDSIVNNIMERFDEKLGTYIFRDDTIRDGEWVDSLPDVTTDFDEADNHYRFSGRHERTALYPLSINRSIVRNNLPLLPWETLDDNVLFRYNRVEGLFLGLNYPQKYHWNGRNTTIFGSGGYAFAAHRWQGGIGLTRQFGWKSDLLELGVEGHSITDSRDQWLVELDENNVASLLFRDDYRDYFRREGMSVWAGLYKQWQRSDMQFQVAYHSDRYQSLPRVSFWSVFKDRDMFRDNPAINDGSKKSIFLTAKYHATESRKIFTTGWSAAASAEIAGKSFGGDFDFNSYLLDIRRYQPISEYDNINIRLRIATATGDVPMQNAFELGGISTLPAFRFKEFAGNRMLLANAEYVVNGRLFDDDDLFPSWLFRNINIILFGDAGYVATAKPGDAVTDGFNTIDSKTIRSDWGFGFGTRDAKLRLGFSWRTDKAGPPMVFIRLNRPF